MSYFSLSAQSRTPDSYYQSYVMFCFLLFAHIHGFIVYLALYVDFLHHRVHCHCL